LLGFLRWVVVERLTTRRPVQPPRSVFPVATPSFFNPRAPAGTLTVTWVGHSTTLIQLGGVNLLTDPIWSECASPVPPIGPRRWARPGISFDQLPSIDVVLLSHNHYDHCDVPTIRRLVGRRADTTWCVPLGVAALLRRCGAEHVVELDWWQSARVGGLEISCTPAQHFSARGPLDRDRTLWCSWAVASPSARVFFGGDSGLHTEYGGIARRHGPFDIVLLPIGAYEPRWFMSPVHMNPEDAIQAHREMTGSGSPPIFVPIHWGTFKLTDEAMNEPPVRIRSAWTSVGNSLDHLWVLRHGETRETSVRTLAPRG